MSQGQTRDGERKSMLSGSLKIELGPSINLRFAQDYNV
jgi:hypothetical protein